MAVSVIMLSWEYPPHLTGGLAVAVSGMARALAQRGHHVSMIVPALFGDEVKTPNVDLIDAAAGLARLSEGQRERFLASLASETDVKLVTVYGPNVPSDPIRRAIQQSRMEVSPGSSLRIAAGYGPSLMHDIHLFARLAALLAGRIPGDMVHGHDWVTYPAAEAWARSAKIPFLCHVHATEFDRSPVVNPDVYAIEKRGFEIADAVVAVSAFTADTIHKRYGIARDKIRIVHNGMDSPPGTQTRSPSRTPTRDVKLTKPDTLYGLQKSTAILRRLRRSIRWIWG